MMLSVDWRNFEANGSTTKKNGVWDGHGNQRPFHTPWACLKGGRTPIHCHVHRKKTEMPQTTGTSHYPIFRLQICSPLGFELQYKGPGPFTTVAVSERRGDLRCSGMGKVGVGTGWLMQRWFSC